MNYRNAIQCHGHGCHSTSRKLNCNSSPAFAVTLQGRWVMADSKAAQGLWDTASHKEFQKDYDGALPLYIKAAQSFLRLSQSSPAGVSRERYTSAGRKCLERAELIRSKKKDLTPVRKDRFSQESQYLVIFKSARINGLKFPAWTRDFRTEDGPAPSAPYNDPDGQPSLTGAQESRLSTWLRPTYLTSSTHPPKVFSDVLRPEDIVQDTITDCSVIAGLAVCLAHHIRFGSKIGLSCLYPQDEHGIPCISPNGQYSARFLVNGIERQVVIDDALLATPVNDDEFRPMTPITSRPRLICASAYTYTNQQHLAGSVDEILCLWPPLVEKAYMKMMGGYDFPGSNSSIDIHALTGWIPEHVSIHGASFQREKIWRRICDSFARGECLVTLGTGASTSSPNSRLQSSLSLVPLHAYAAVDIKEISNRRLLRVINPWGDVGHDRSSETLPDIAGLDLIDAGDHSSRILTLEWDDVCELFDSVYLNWDPSRLSLNHQATFHGLWSTQDPNSVDLDSGVAQLATNHQFRLVLDMPASQLEDVAVWCLLTRHVTSKHDTGDFIALHVFPEEQSSTGMHDVASEDSRPVKGTYSDSPHILVRVLSTDVAPRLSLIVSHYPSDGDVVVQHNHRENIDVGYTLSVYAAVPVHIQDVPGQLLHHKKAEGRLTSKNSGGNSTYPTFMENPQYKLRIHALSSSATTSRSQPGKIPLRISLQASKDAPVNVKVVYSSGQRITDLVQGDIVLDSGAYNYSFARGAQKLHPGVYTLVVSAFTPNVQTAYRLSVECGSVFDIDPIPHEGAGMFSKAIKGSWQGASAAGPPSGGAYASNPLYLLSISSATQLQIRLQPTDAHTHISLNVTVFSRDSGISPLAKQISTSGGYTDAISGAVTSRTHVSAGEYVIVPSTQRSGTEGRFILSVYSSAAAVVVKKLV